jgi:hypothetical protein
MLRLMEKMTEKLARWKNNKHFNLRCVRCNVVPKCLHLKPPIKGTSAKNLIQKTERRLLNIAIAQCQYTIRKLEDIKQETLENLRSQVSSETMDAILKHVTSVHEREFATAKDRQCRKFMAIKSKATEEQVSSSIDTNRWVLNLSKHQISEEEKNLLSKGLNFAVTPQQLPVSDIIATTEQACQQLQDSGKATCLRGEVVRILSKRRKIHQNISTGERQALMSLSKRKELKILPADKGRVTVVMDSEEYHSKVNELLSDQNTYEKLSTDPTNKYKTKLTKLIRGWKDEDKITRQTWQSMYPTAAETPKFYGLPKVHKANHPLRPIVSSVGSVTYGAAKYLAKILGPLAGKTKHHVKNSVDFVNKIGDLEVPPPWKLVSFL